MARKIDGRDSSSNAVNIEDEDTDRLARELAELTGQPITAVVRPAIEERLFLLRRRDAIAPSPDLGEIITRGRQRRLLDERAETEILGYDDGGFPDCSRTSPTGTCTPAPSATCVDAFCGRSGSALEIGLGVPLRLPRRHASAGP